MEVITMKKRYKALAVVLSAAMIGGCIGMSAYAVNNSDNKSEGSDSQASVSTENASSKSETSKTSTGDKLSKEETVYVIAQADGSVDKVIVSDWIKNGTNASSIDDKTELKDIKNVKGDEAYTLSGDNMCVWDAKGNDIYYQGTTNKELPVAVKVSYLLDGKSITSKELAGKSGKVTIRFDYTNNQYVMANINGNQEKIYVPFAMMTGLMLDNDKFTNVQVTNGKIVNEGEKTIVAGIAFPGLETSLGLVDVADISIPDYVEITADVKAFELGNTVTIASNSALSELGTDKLDTSKLKENVDKITDGMSQLLDGSSQLYEGLCQLLDKSDTLVTGIKALAKGAAELKAGAAELNAGATKLDAGASKANAGAQELKEGLETLEGNNTALVGGAKQIYESVLDNAKTQINAAFDKKIADIKATPGYAEDNPAFATPIAFINSLKITDFTIANYSDVLNNIINKLSTDPESKALVEGAKNKIDTVNTWYEGLKAYTAGVTKAKTGATELAAGINELKNGTTALSAGTKSLSAGASQLYDGIMQLDENSPLLQEGIKKLRDGSMSLSDGLKNFNEEGIKKITDLIDGNVNNIVERMKATVNAANSYNTYAGKADNMDGTVKFIYKTAEVK